MQEVTRKLGTPVGEHRALRIVRLLVSKGIIVRAGSYRQRYNTRYPSGFRVPLYRLGAKLRRRSSRQVKVSVRRRAPRKRWWQHPLFGFGSKSYPQGLPKRLRKWKPPPEWVLEEHRA